MMFLRFDSEAAARAAFADHLIEGKWPAYIGTVAVDVVGIIHRPTGNMLADDVPEMAALEGFHINLSDSVPDLAAYEIERPSNPAQVFFGDPG
jgi:hypothetical protein